VIFLADGETFWAIYSQHIATNANITLTWQMAQGALAPERWPATTGALPRPETQGARTWGCCSASRWKPSRALRAVVDITSCETWALVMMHEYIPCTHSVPRRPKVRSRNGSYLPSSTMYSPLMCGSDNPLKTPGRSCAAHLEELTRSGTNTINQRGHNRRNYERRQKQIEGGLQCAVTWQFCTQGLVFWCNRIPLFLYSSLAFCHIRGASYGHMGCFSSVSGFLRLDSYRATRGGGTGCGVVGSWCQCPALVRGSALLLSNFLRAAAGRYLGTYLLDRPAAAKTQPLRDLCLVDTAQNHQLVPSPRVQLHPVISGFSRIPLEKTDEARFADIPVAGCATGVSSELASQAGRSALPS